VFKCARDAKQSIWPGGRGTRRHCSSGVLQRRRCSRRVPTWRDGPPRFRRQAMQHLQHSRGERCLALCPRPPLAESVRVLWNSLGARKRQFNLHGGEMGPVTRLRPWRRFCGRCFLAVHSHGVFTRCVCSGVPMLAFALLSFRRCQKFAHTVRQERRRRSRGKMRNETQLHSEEARRKVQASLASEQPFAGLWLAFEQEHFQLRSVAIYKSVSFGPRRQFFSHCEAGRYGVNRPDRR